jgi:hypothetical protein
MPLTEKGEKVMASMKKQYGPEKGKQVFYASKNAGKLTGVDDDAHIAPHLKGTITRLRDDDNQHMGFSSEGAKKISEMCDALSSRLDAFEKRRAMRRPVDVKPRTKDNMQPSNPHPRAPGNA